MAPALTAEPLSPKEKLTSNASPATGTRKSVRKLESPNVSGGGGSGGNDTAKKPTTATVAATGVATITTITTTAGVAATTTTRVTRSKDAAQRIGSPVVPVTANKRKSSNNNNTHNNKNNNSSCSSGSGSEVKPGNDQMGLSAAATHTSTDGNAASTSNSSSSDATAATSDAAADAAAAVNAVDEHNNNCKDNSTAELLANLTNDFEEAITAEICLRKTLPEVSLSKEQPAAATATADPAQLTEPMSMSEAYSQSSTSSAAGAALPQSLPATASLPPPPPLSKTAAATVTSESPQLLEQQQQQEGFPGNDISSLERTSVPVEEDAAKILDNIEERLSQLDGSPVALPPIVDISAATLEASVELPTTRCVQQLPQPEQAQSLPQPEQEQPQQEQSQQLPEQEQLQQQQQQDILASPQHLAIRQPGAVLTPQSTASSINFLKDGAAGAVLEDQDIEEVLKALKNLDGTHVNPDICDFNFFNEVCFLNNEEETAAASGVAGASTTAPEGGSISMSSSSLVAHNLDVEESSPKASCSSSNINIVAPKPRPWQECHAELEQQQNVLVRKIDFLLRRMRKFQVRQMCRHASDEVAGILEWSARYSNKASPGAPVRSAKLTEQEDTVLSIVSGRPGNSFWEEQTKQPLPATQMSNVIRHIETAARKQQICHTIGGGSASLASSSSWYSNAAQPGKRSRKLQNMDAIAGSNNTDSIVMPRADEIVPNYDNYVTSELTHVAGLLHTEMREVQNAIDSDATESSSGGESADEMVNYNNSQQLSLSITRRAVWRYSRDRAAIALRWSWLCAQVADLDMKIRQHNDVYNDLCRTKGDVMLESTTAPKNGYKETQTQPPSVELPPGAEMEQQPPADWLCSRTRPLVLSEFRKRKLFQTINMHTISKKAARPSNIKCGCQWPQVPCTLCTGRPDPTAPRELPETLMPQNRVALLDASYHPVLSFTDDVCQSLHLEAISRQPDWQYRVMRSQAKAIVKGVWKAEREAIALSGGGGGGAGGAGRRPGETVKRRYVRRKERNNNNNSNSNRSSSNINNNNNNNNNNNINNNNNNKESTTTTTAPTTATATAIQSGTGGGGLDSGNGTGTATTSSSSTPTTTPLVANTVAVKRQRQSVKTSGNGSLNSPLSDPQQQQQQRNNNNQQNNPSLISRGNGNGAKKPRKSASKQQQQQHSAHNTNNNHNNSQPASGADSTTRFPADSQWEQSQSRRNSAETHGHRNERTAERRSRLIYDIDNIVIPYSMAAQTRVEILPYKEIPTPKWRIVDSDNKNKQQHSTDEKLSNGCANQAEAETESPLSREAVTATMPADEVTATSTPAATTSKEKQEAVGKVNGLTATTTSPAATTLKDKQETVSKVNGLKQLSKKKSLPEIVKQSDQSLSNGLANGNAQQAEASEEEQLSQPTTVNGKIQRNNNKISVKSLTPASAAAITSTPATISTPTPTAASQDAKPLTDEVEPPKKRPKLQLKEKTKPSTSPKSIPTAAEVAVDADEEEEVEDISDEAYIVRHQRALIEERRRFETYLRFPWSTRSRANRRADSRAESSGANTPDPASPAAPQLAGPTGMDNESIPSPLAQTMLQNPLDGVNAEGELATTMTTTKGKRQERRRTTSSKLKDQDRRSATPDTRELPQLPLDPPPFEPLQFPLSKDVYQRLLAEMNIEPKAPRLSLPVTVNTKRTKSKSVSSNGGDGNTTATTATNSSSRRSSKAKATNASKLAQTTTTMLMTQRLNGGKNAQRATAQLNGGKHVYDNGIVYGPEDDDDDEDDEEEEEEELLLEEDDDYHYLAPPEDDQLPSGIGDDANLYNASIDAYLGEQEGLDEEELADDPFMDDDPNDPEWKRSVAVRNERMRRRV
ncbi:uncharacterized protein LOC117792499 [Drosophila innubila]|uniref:uncharacterized protein LOC117792499 n=1 Tax=Drosophila innubila TaxID=198719 RepID=UPI00148B37E1|nr:uncharacterized protein LOC117792499 [Drosophila innubila]